ncbi:anhydro-N-acetylmuramic acid kinase [Pelomyxa schiedti]|nr:anhydro-N-acetylmuramic acid kinase [Pelomyxa schiedti]
MATAARMRAIGLMSGTSMDGIDVAVIETDGHRILSLGQYKTYKYKQLVTDGLRRIAVLGGSVPPDLDLVALERQLTDDHVEAVKSFMEEFGYAPADIDIIGFHGHTIYHNPAAGITTQIGDGQHLANATGIDVVYQLRINDVKNGGQGAPLVPVYHAALLEGANEISENPVAILNIGGVSNITCLWRAHDGIEVVAFDTGPGNALIDDWALRHTGKPCDYNGTIDTPFIERVLQKPYFRRSPPKSLDRGEFLKLIDEIETHSPADGAATLTYLTASACAAAREHLPTPPVRWFVTGGGRSNPTLMKYLQNLLTPATVDSVERLNWRGDSLEAEAFALLAVRSKLGLPITFPKTTGAKVPLTGGILCRSNTRS